MKNSKILTSTLLLLAACSSLNQGIKSRQQKESLQKTKASSGLPPGPGTDNKSAKVMVRKLEGALSTKKEIEQYSKALPWFETDKEKLDFLNLPDFEAKQNWLNEKSFASRAKAVQADMEELVEVQDIAIGMPFNLVRKSWGDPNSVEVSGNPQFKNERWRYHKYISTPDGYKDERKVVYFEGGKVVGWELE